MGIRRQRQISPFLALLINIQTLIITLTDIIQTKERIPSLKVNMYWKINVPNIEMLSQVNTNVNMERLLQRNSSEETRETRYFF